MQTESSKDHLDLHTQVANDLQILLSKYKNPKVGLRQISAQIQVSEKTITRLINKENKPTYQTLYKIYRVIYSTSDDTKLLGLMPPVVQDEIKRHNPLKQHSTITYKKEIENEILYDRCFAEIYFMASCSPLSRDLIQLHFGLNGIETSERMVELGALKRTREGLYTVGDVQTNLDAQTLKRVGLSISEKYAKIQNTQTRGNNLIAFYVEGLSDEAYEQWLKIDQEAFYKKVEIANSEGSKGNKRAFTFTATDTMSLK